MKLITANKLNKFWQNGILPELGKRIANSRVLKTSEEVEANTNEENIASANVVGELINNLKSGLGGNNLIYNESEDAYYIQHGADAVLKKLGNPEPSSSRFRHYRTSVGSSNTYQLPDGIYVYFTMNGGGGTTTVHGSIWQANFPTDSANFQYGKYGIADTSKSNVVSQRVNDYDHTATALFYKISD